MTEAVRRKVFDTRLDRFLDGENVDLALLARATGMSRQNLERLRQGKRNARQETIVRLVISLRRLLKEPVGASDLFYLGEQHDDDTPEAKRFLAEPGPSFGWRAE
jgi:transcriptional regulator with XRE-family HTH domain